MTADSGSEDLRATRTRPFATTVAADSSGEKRPSMADVTLPELGEIVGGLYRLVRRLGEGNFGRVYVAERIDVPEHRVAIKLLPRSFYVGRNVERELVMLAMVGHPNVVQLKDHGFTADYVWLTMPVYEGETLEERLSRGPLSLREAHDIFLPLARALEALHAAGLRHQDVKPENLYLAQFAGRLHPVLLDLGMAAEKDGTFVAGTALYAAPEQLAAILGLFREAPLTEKMDVYCLGATLLYSLVGERDFPGAKALTREEVVASHETRATTPLAARALPTLTGAPRESLVRELAAFMALDPEDRPSMREVAERLDVLLDQEREEARAEERAQQAQKRALGRARLGAVALLLAATALGGVALWKRETLRLASALAEARAAGAESFDKLDTCVASHAVAKREAATCEDRLAAERSEHDRTLASLAEQGEGCTKVVDQMQDLRGTVAFEQKVHAEELHACTTEKEQLATSWNVERERLETERDACEAEIQTRATELEQLRAERDACLATRPEPGPAPGPVPTASASAQPSAPPTGSGEAPPPDTVTGAGRPTGEPPTPVAPPPDPQLAPPPGPAAAPVGGLP